MPGAVFGLIKAMIGISKVMDTNRYGTVTHKDGKVISFNEKGKHFISILHLSDLNSPLDIFTINTSWR